MQLGRQEAEDTLSKAKKQWHDGESEREAQIRAQIGAEYATDLQRTKSKLAEESTERRRLFNIVQELKGNIRVMARIRPMTETEVASNCSLITSFPDIDEVSIERPGKARTQKYRFTRAFPPSTTQVQFFEEIEPLMTSVMDGYHVSVFAYGQTGSGKTFTMHGENVSNNECCDEWGVAPRMLSGMFDTAKAMSDTMEYTFRLSFLEVYNEKAYDLLASNPHESEVEIRQNLSKVHISGASVIAINSAEEALTQLRKGMRHRAVVWLLTQQLIRLHHMRTLC